MKLRSLNPHLWANFKAMPKPTQQYGFKNIHKELACQQVLDHVNLGQKYPNARGNLDIIDVFSGYGLLSTMINYELKPRNHIIIDDTKGNKIVWEKRIAHLESETGNREHFKYFNMDGHAWGSYDTLLKQMKVITPSVQPRTQVHDELLIVANLTSTKVGESLFAQWIQCCACSNWLQKYGRVRMLVLVRETTSAKFLSGPSFSKRNRTSLKRDVYTDIKLIAVSDVHLGSQRLSGEAFDPNILVKDQPVVIPSTSIAPDGGDLSVVEVLPRVDLSGIDVNALDYLARILMYRSLNTVAEGLAAIAPGAAEYLSPKLSKEILMKLSRELTREDIIQIQNVYNNWAFKPSYEETINFFSEGTRNF